MSMAKLISISAPALSDSGPELGEAASALAGELKPQLLALLSLRNGFYAFESALHVRPANGSRPILGLTQ